MKLGRFETNHIYNEDCYKAIKDIPDKSVDCIYTDIPYLIVSGGGGHSDLSKRIEKVNKDYLEEIKDGINYDILNQFCRVMKKINIFIWCSKLQLLDIMNYFIGEKGCYFELLTWNKSNPTPSTNNSWLPDIEYCLYFRESGVVLNDGYELKSKWYASPINKKDKDKFNHPTIKPLELVEKHLKHTTQENDIVLDTFLGSGTTAVACKNTNRQYIGFEINKKWFDIAKNRLRNIDASGQIGMFTL